MIELGKKEYFPEDPTPYPIKSTDTPHRGAVPPGESDMDMDPETVRATADLIVGKVEKKLRDIVQEEADKANKAWDNSPRVLRLSDGSVMPLGSPRGSKFGDAGRAPGFIRQRGEDGYSLARLWRSLVEKDKSLAPGEWDISQKLAQAGFQPAYGGAMIPLAGGDLLFRNPGYEQALDDLAMTVKQMLPFLAPDPDELAYARKAMDPLDDTGGGSLVGFPAMGAPIQLLRPRPVVEQAGARLVPLPAQGSIFYPSETGDAVFHFVAPNQSIDDSTPSTGGVSLLARRAAGLIKMPNDLNRYPNAAAETMLRVGILKRAGLTEDQAFLEGTGGAQPLGIVKYPRSTNNIPTVGSVTLHVAGTTGADGNTFLPEDVLRMLALVEEAPDPDGATAWILRPGMFAALANLRSATDAGAGTGPFLFPVTRGALGGAVVKELGGLPVLASTQISKARVKGSSGATLTYILVGDFRQCLLGRAGAIELASSVDAGFSADQTWLRCITRFDIALAHPEAFCICDDLVIPS